ncbi:hypothetical protein NHQ30_008567 [Ciborinia camelliae]|nr:hypothetical protein NHQ30_008567 [Ciborinia camelliae]
MNLLDLPLDLIHKFLLYAVISRGVTRALRLKLVCKQFYNHLQPALFESRILDDFAMEDRFGDLKFMELWYIRKNYGAEKLWHSYLVYRVHNETDPEVGRFLEIRQVAEAFCHQTEAEYETVVDSLCWLALERGACYPGHQQGWRAWSDREDEAPNPGLNLLSVAAFFDSSSLARRLLLAGHCPTTENLLFPTPMQLAAWAGNADMLKLFQEHLPEFEDIPPRHGDNNHWRGKTGPGSIKGASISGDMNMVRLAVYPPSRSNTNSTDFFGQRWGVVNTKSGPSSDLASCLYFAKTWEVFQYIDDFLIKGSFWPSESSHLLRHYAGLGNLEIIQKLLDAGADIHGGNGHNRNPLIVAARHCHEDIVDLLLERGADPNNYEAQQRGPPLAAAINSGSIAIVRKLLDYGAKIDEYGSSFLRRAVRLEHTAMVELLLDLNINIDSRDRSNLIKKALDDGLESMALLLEQKCPILPPNHSLST